MTLGIPPDIRDQRRLRWQRHRRYEHLFAVLTAVYFVAAFVFESWWLCLVAAIAHAAGDHHGCRRSDLEVRP